MIVEKNNQLKTISKFSKLLNKGTFSDVKESDNFEYKVKIDSHQKAEFIAAQSLFTNKEASLINRARSLGGCMDISFYKQSGVLEVVVYESTRNLAPILTATLTTSE